MAELHLARTTGTDGKPKIVVLKRILPHLAEDPEFVRMFKDEAYLAATLDHPNIVRVYDLGRHGEDFFFTMEYIHGEDLRKILIAAKKRSQHVPWPHTLTIALGVTSALHYAHEQVDDNGRPLHVVHRDVSPTNVLVATNGGIKLVDFGIAKAAAATHVTRAGMLKGKAAYMAPEQCRAEAVDRRSDVFAIGILLYEMTTLSRLFRGDNDLAILNQVLNADFAPPSTRRQGYPPDFEAIVLRALATEPQDRYPTALEMQQDLERFAHTHDIRPSKSGLAEYLRELFGEKPLPWAAHLPDDIRPAPPRRHHTYGGRRLPAPVLAMHKRQTGGPGPSRPVLQTIPHPRATLAPPADPLVVSQPGPASLREEPLAPGVPDPAQPLYTFDEALLPARKGPTSDANQPQGFAGPVGASKATATPKPSTTRLVRRATPRTSASTTSAELLATAGGSDFENGLKRARIGLIVVVFAAAVVLSGLLAWALWPSIFVFVMP